MEYTGTASGGLIMAIDTIMVHEGSMRIAGSVLRVKFAAVEPL